MRQLPLPLPLPLFLLIPLLLLVLLQLLLLRRGRRRRARWSRRRCGRGCGNGSRGVVVMVVEGPVITRVVIVLRDSHDASLSFLCLLLSVTLKAYFLLLPLLSSARLSSDLAGLALHAPVFASLFAFPAPPPPAACGPIRVPVLHTGPGLGCFRDGEKGFDLARRHTQQRLGL